MARGGRSGGNRPAVTRNTQISKTMSWLLRHGAEKEGLTFTSSGFLPVSAVLQNQKLKSLKVTFDEVKEVVKEDAKGRFSLVTAASLAAGKDAGEDVSAVTGQVDETSNDPKDWLIRANQGHSLKIEDADGLLTPITADNMPAMVVHGTTRSAWPLILASGGLKPMGRNHVHFATDLPPAWSKLQAESANSVAAVDDVTAKAAVVSGMRTSSSVLIYLDLAKALEKGIKFGLSENGVVLTEGDESGLVPIGSFSKVEERGGEGLVLVEAGQVVADIPEGWGKAKGKGKG
ncbi:tRNA 2'-phosphotransferase [Oleoguttula sp. CCFEE 5521]